jgi:hypothetical protein
VIKVNLKTGQNRTAETPETRMGIDLDHSDHLWHFDQLLLFQGTGQKLTTCPPAVGR